MKKLSKHAWTAAHSAELYGINNWGAGYFGVADNGEVSITAQGTDGKLSSVSMLSLVKEIKERGMDMPVLIRVENILAQQIIRLNEAFNRAITNGGYQAPYRGVFPVKVNQQSQVIEEIAQVGAKYGHGLEAGSKPELLIALAHLESREACIVCNGYKDEEFIDLGLQALKMGYRVFFVIETLTELPIIIERSRALGIKPLIGVRVKLASMVGGHWNASSGDRSIFGLTIAQLVSLLDTLKAEDMLDCLQLLHYHLGSQIPNIRDIRTGVLEACQVYRDLVTEGACMGYLDLGGGLAVDYDGSKTNYLHSRNYTINEYCNDIIDVVMSTLDPSGVAHPTLITESGRATVAYSSVLLFNVLDVANFEPGPLPETISPDENPMILKLWELQGTANVRNIQECYNDALFYRDETRELFKAGQVNLRSRSLAENLFLQIMHQLLDLADDAPREHREMEKLRELLSDIYYCNFSLFQSLPDVWAIDQIFPVMPIHRLTEEPTRQGIIADITCDCDGKIDKFVDTHNTKRTLPLHTLKDNDEYYIGVFLVGAYQETLGDLHNLFGDTNVANVRITADGNFEFIHEIQGDSIADVLSYVEYNPQQMQDRFRRIAERAVGEGRITAKERSTIMSAFSASMRGYTYYER
ncbi:MAG: biosynthetic arginine decarboxylase [Pseudomonadales bacterium]|nr:biosynthetic arginine decarboxylase [Pseudomonadales bacterium]MDP4639924.1 biosynthetic arginine decarboxylase [Pseudomonadales bacterium]MDP4765227.1 biosynthetic arginine decarboxylase [Pseudomonadales bacterium]MDP4911819.1 biosynthetic arginine decarboxylase [Pseudomonadales bacterium]MDP5059926.1 biosynthetic arginine decarboxylase [Pseudomonadales bacterium]